MCLGRGFWYLVSEKVCFICVPGELCLLNTYTVSLAGRGHFDIAGCCFAISFHLLANAELHRLLDKGRDTQKCFMKEAMAKEIFCALGLDFN